MRQKTSSTFDVSDSTVIESLCSRLNTNSYPMTMGPNRFEIATYYHKMRLSGRLETIVMSKLSKRPSSGEWAMTLATHRASSWPITTGLSLDHAKCCQPDSYSCFVALLALHEGVVHMLRNALRKGVDETSRFETRTRWGVQPTVT